MRVALEDEALVGRGRERSLDLVDDVACTGSGVLVGAGRVDGVVGLSS